MSPIRPSRHPAAGRTAGGAPQWEVADIFRLSGAAYRAASPRPRSAPQVMHDRTVCRTAQRGGHTEQCPPGGGERYASHACRKRHWPKCQTLLQAPWVADRHAERLPVP